MYRYSRRPSNKVYNSRDGFHGKINSTETGVNPAGRKSDQTVHNLEHDDPSTSGHQKECGREVYEEFCDVPDGKIEINEHSITHSHA